jgi:hypothetical protein
MTSSPINDPAYWRRRAEEARRIAQQLDDPIAKQAMLEIAQSYESLASLTLSRPASKASK